MGRIAQQLRIPAIELRQKSAREARGLGRRGEPIVNPLPLRLPLDEPGLAEDLQVTRYARFALFQRPSEVGHTERRIGAQREQPQSARLTGCTQPFEEYRRRQSHLKNCTRLVQFFKWDWRRRYS